jgi:hypothetical protein
LKNRGVLDGSTIERGALSADNSSVLIDDNRPVFAVHCVTVVILKMRLSGIVAVTLSPNTHLAFTTINIIPVTLDFNWLLLTLAFASRTSIVDALDL